MIQKHKKPLDIASREVGIQVMAEICQSYMDLECQLYGL